MIVVGEVLTEGSGWRKIDMLVDSGAEMSIIAIKGCPVEAADQVKSVSGIGGAQKVGPKTECKIRFACDTEKEYSIWLHATKLDRVLDLIILGRDFLNQFEKTTFDWKNGKIFPGDTWLFLVDTHNTHWDINRELNAEQENSIRMMLNNYPEVFADNPRAPRECSATFYSMRSKHNQPMNSKIRRIPQKWVSEVDTQVADMIKNGIIEESASPYNSNIILVDKDDGTKRFVVDYRELNKDTIPHTYPLLSVDEMLEQSFGCRFFSQLDLASAYWAIPITEADRCKTAFGIPRGKFQFRRMPFGLRNAQATFQRCMDNVVAECKKRGATGLDAYVDNVIISTVSFAEQCSSLAILLTVLDNLGMSLRHDKCEFAKSSIGLSARLSDF